VSPLHPDSLPSSPGPRSAPFGATFPQVLAAAQADAPWAYRRLFAWLGRPVAGYLRGQGADDPDGLANDVFLRAFTNLAGFQGGEERFRSWIFTIAHHVLIDDRRRAARRPPRAGWPVTERPGAASTEGDALARLGTRQVEELLAELTPDQRDVLLLRIVADLTVEQVAETLGKAPGAIKALQRRGLATLRRRLEGTAAAGTMPSGRARTLSPLTDVHP